MRDYRVEFLDTDGEQQVKFVNALNRGHAEGQIQSQYDVYCFDRVSLVGLPDVGCEFDNFELIG